MQIHRGLVWKCPCRCLFGFLFSFFISANLFECNLHESRVVDLHREPALLARVIIAILCELNMAAKGAHARSTRFEPILVF